MAPLPLQAVLEAAPPKLNTVPGPDPTYAAVASLVLPGAGQLWVGQTTKGVGMLIIAVFTLSLCGLLNVIAAFDAFQVASRRARGETLGEWQMF